jgi:ribosome-associated protein
LKTTLPSEEKARLVLDAVEDRKAVDPVLLDLRDKSLLADFFLICSGTSNVHIRAIADRVLEKTDDLRLSKPRIEGQEIGQWVLLDYGDVVLHILDEESRERYKLEKFWTTPQPKGALPPTPTTVYAGSAGPNRVNKADDLDEDQLGNFDDDEDEEEDDEDGAFFANADTEVEPVDEGEEDDLNDATDDGAESASTPHDGTGGGHRRS